MSRLPAVLALCAATLQIPQSAAQVITSPPPQPAEEMLCVGQISQANNMVWDSPRVEFSFPYARTQQTALLKSSIAQLNAPLLLESDEAFLRGRETKARNLSAEDRTLLISELKISRSTGAFTLVVLLFRNVDVLEGRSLWEGSCGLRGAAAKKF